MPAPTVVDNHHWNTIVERIYRRECVPFLGAAVNINSDTKKYSKGLPMGKGVTLRLLEHLLELKKISAWEDLAEVMAKDLRFDKDGPFADLSRVEMQDLARVALHLRTKVDNPRLVGMVKEILNDDEAVVEPSPLLNTLATMPFRLVVTTNYDRLMERALKHRHPYVITQPIKGFSSKEQNRLKKELSVYLAADQVTNTILYKVHGSFAEERDPLTRALMDRSSIIISEEDYIQFLTTIGNDTKGLPNMVKQWLKDSTLLFLGYSLEDWDIRTLYEGLIETLETQVKRDSFAIQLNPPDFWVRYWAKKDVIIYNVDLYEFADELDRRYRAYEAAHPR